MKFTEWLLQESNSRYSVGVDYRTSMEDVLRGFAKISLGYVSAGMKRSGYHVKTVFEESPLRVLVSSRNWDDGEWVGMVSYNPKLNCFILSRGFYNKDKKTITIQKSEKCQHDNAGDVVNELRKIMNDLKSKKNNYKEKLRSAKLKTGPK